MDFTSTKRVCGQSNRAGLQDSSRAAPSAGAAAFERQLSEIANSGGGGGAMPAGSALQPARATKFLRRLSKHPVHFRDEDFILSLEEALVKGNAAESTAENNVSTLLNFGHWLFANNKDPMEGRLDKQSLTDDARKFIGNGDPSRLFAAIGHLRTSRSTGGIVPIAGRSKLTPYLQDATLIDEYRNEAATNTGSTNATVLRSFSDYLRQSNKKGIADRLSGKALDGDVKGYKDAGGHRNIGHALACLRKSQAGLKVVELERHIPPVPDRLELMDEPGPSSSAPRPAQSAPFRRKQQPRNQQLSYPQDASLILGLEKALNKGNAAEDTVKNNVRILRRFGRWLLANNKDPISNRLNSESLIEDAREFVGKGNPTRLITAIGHFRTEQSTGGVVLIAGRAELTPHPEDAALIKEYRKEATTDTGSTNAVALRSFSDYLRQNNKKGIAGRLSEKALAEDVKAYKNDAGGQRNIGAALAHLRKSHAGVKAMERERNIPPVRDPAGAALMEPGRVGEAIAQHSPSQEPGSWPKELSAAAHDQDVRLELMDEAGPSSSPQRPGQSVRLRNQPLYREDAPLILGLKGALIKGGATESTAKHHLSTLLSFGRWLLANNKDPIKDRLDHGSLNEDAREFIGEGDPSRLLAAIGHLRTSQSTGGIVPIAGRAELKPCPQDAVLIERYRKEAPTKTGRRNATVLRSFSDYLRQNNKKGIADRLSGKALDGDVTGYKKNADGYQAIGYALASLRKSHAGVKAMERERHIPAVSPEWVIINKEHSTTLLRPAKRQRTLNTPPTVAIQQQLGESGNSGGRIPMQPSTYQMGALQAETSGVGGATAQQSAPHEAIALPSVVAIEDYDQDLLWGEVDKAGPLPSLGSSASHHQPPDSAGAVHPLNWRHDHQSAADELPGSNVLPSRQDGGVEAMVHENPPTPFELNAWVAAPDFQPLFTGPVPAHHQGVRQPGSLQELSPVPASSDDEALAWLSEELVRRMLRETEWQPMMQEPGSAAVPGAGGPGDFHLVNRRRLPPMTEAAPAQPTKASEPASPVTARAPDTYRGLPVVDLTASTPTSSDAQIGPSGPRALSNVPNGSVLGATEWLSDAHIQRDYDLLAEELRGIDPTLAARTRLVDPSVSHLLRHATPQDAQATLQAIYNQNVAPADFLFVPVNNGTPTNPGTHWSLLLVDRRNPEMRVAYHYDSLQRRGYNDEPATQLARVLNATWEPAPMTRQPNDYDCGVSVLDGTWALVGQLMAGQRPDHGPLPLDDLIADRQALQERLRRRLPHEQEPRQLLDDEPASPPMMAFEPGELRQLLGEEFASSSPRTSSTPPARTDGVHQPTQAPWLPERTR
ncbi:Ulp1 family isopeptidase [Mesorhizobium onobrychidis]|uniref:Ubiquitin-like protease family profile domain-containing protein n=1 Tax=Mesorhizobium onobrychidis TaxID=2775404 RepID=A0ABY5QWW4_9HYPH|nr:Ulp1 family isopeptidase [Mesorhizobium onobrychidis]UVC15206.1 hypothetical protein IHQ72_32390 [Mesorhizobium onobrychidis]